MKKGAEFLTALFLLFSASCALGQVYEAWVQIYNGPANDDDQVRDIAVDDSGNSYVTGWSKGVGTGYDIATIKYTQEGDTAWVRRYSWESDFEDIPQDVEVDQAGNVYVTGYSRDSLTGPDIVTIKYDRAGETLWVRRFNGAGNGGDGPAKLKIGKDGYVYITGSSEGIGTYADFCTIKYTPDGEIVWVRTLNGPANWMDGGEDLAFDQSGNIYVTGITEGIGSGRDVTTLKYSSSGDLLWSRTYNSPTNDHDFVAGVEVDASGNVYVAGTSKYADRSRDVRIIKYSPDGNQVWFTTYNSPENDEESAEGVKLDAKGNLYTAGQIGRWSLADYLTLKFDNAGRNLWAQRYDGPPHDYFDTPTALAVDDSGNIYVTGYGYGIGTRMDFATLKYSPSGRMMWVARFNLPPDFSEEAYCMALDKSGNIYVSGITEIYTDTLTVIENFATVKYSPCPVWVGDLDGDHVLGIVDLVYLVNILFRSWQIPKNPCVADVNNDGKVNLSDFIYLANYVFKNGYAPVLNGKCCP